MPPTPNSNRGITVKGKSFDLSGIYRRRWWADPNTPSVGVPAAASANGFMLSFAGPNTATVIYGPAPNANVAYTGALGPSGKTDWPRNVVITVTHASAVVALSGVITGKDALGRDMTEAWAVTAGTTSKTFTGAKAFSKVDSISVVAAADASADSVVIGTGNVLGIDLPVAAPKPVLELTDGAIVTTGTVVAASTSAAADPLGTYTPATAPNGAHTYDVWVVIEDEENVT
jgi:hypothetical protein